MRISSTLRLHFALLLVLVSWASVGVGCKTTPKVETPKVLAAPTLASLTQDWDVLLKQHVKEGWVDYENLKKDNRFTELLANQAKFDPATLTERNQKIAFWINVYNICTIQLILKHYPVGHWDDIVEPDAEGNPMKPWAVEFCQVGGQKLALDFIEGGLLLGELDKSEVHFAANCAAKSCPVLRGEAYAGDRLDAQLAEQYRIFMSDRVKNYFDPKKRTMYLSMIYQWYQPDFEKNGGKLLSYIHDALPEEAQKLAKKKRLKVEYLEYLWVINDVKNAGK